MPASLVIRRSFCALSFCIPFRHARLLSRIVDGARDRLWLADIMGIAVKDAGVDLRLDPTDIIDFISLSLTDSNRLSDPHYLCLDICGASSPGVS